MDTNALKSQLTLAKLNLDNARRQMILDDGLARESRKAFYRMEGRVSMLIELIKLDGKQKPIQKIPSISPVTKNGQERR